MLSRRSSPLPYRSATSRTSSSARSFATIPPETLASSSALIRSPTARKSPSSVAARVVASGELIAPLLADVLRRGVQSLQLLAPTQVHVHTARQARVEATDRTHNVDALEVLQVVLLEDRLVLHRILIRAWSSVGVAGVRVPRRGRVGMVVRDLAVPDHHVVAEHTPHRLGEPHPDAFVGHRELLPRLCPSGADLLQGLLDEMQRAGSGVGLEVGPCPVPLPSVAPLGNVPLQVAGTIQGRLRKVDLHAVAGVLYVANVEQPGQCSGAKPGQRAAAGVQG